MSQSRVSLIHRIPSQRFKRLVRMQLFMESSARTWSHNDMPPEAVELRESYREDLEQLSKRDLQEIIQFIRRNYDYYTFTELREICHIEK